MSGMSIIGPLIAKGLSQSHSEHGVLGGLGVVPRRAVVSARNIHVNKESVVRMALRLFCLVSFWKIRAKDRRGILQHILQRKITQKCHEYWQRPRGGTMTARVIARPWLMTVIGGRKCQSHPRSGHKLACKSSYHSPSCVRL